MLPETRATFTYLQNRMDFLPGGLETSMTFRKTHRVGNCNQLFLCNLGINPGLLPLPIYRKTECVNQNHSIPTRTPPNAAGHVVPNPSKTLRNTPNCSLGDGGFGIPFANRQLNGVSLGDL